MGAMFWLILTALGWVLALSQEELPGGVFSAIFLLGLSVGLVSRVLDELLWGFKAKRLEASNKSRMKKLRDRWADAEEMEAIIDNLALAAVAPSQDLLDWFEKPGDEEPPE